MNQFNILMQVEQVQEELEEQDKIVLVKYLYNDGYGEIDVSQECRDKYKELFLEDLSEDIMGCRSNQNLIKVFELLGSDKCSGSPACIRLSVQWIPKEMEEQKEKLLSGFKEHGLNEKKSN